MTTTDTNPSEQAPEKRRGRLPAQSIDNCVLDPEDRWLSPKTVAVMLDFSEDWLSQLREGLKGIEGPPFKKLGDAKSSPVRYNLARLREWMNRFPELASNAGAAPTFHFDGRLHQWHELGGALAVCSDRERICRFLQSAQRRTFRYRTRARIALDDNRGMAGYETRYSSRVDFRAT